MTNPVRSFFRYLPVYPGMEDWGVRVLDAGCTQVPAGTIYPAPGHPEDHHFSWEEGRRLSAWTFVYITAGRGVFESRESGVCEIQPGSVFVIFPGVWHRFGPDSATGWDEYWVECDGPLMESAIARLGLTPEKPLLRTGHDDAFLRCFLDIMETVQAEPPGFQAIVGMQSLVLVARLRSLLQVAKEQGATSAGKIARQAIVIMRESLDRNMDWEDVARRLGVSYSSFRRLFRQATGRSPGNYFIEMKINRARQLLEMPGCSIQRISEQLGFESVSYFSTLFKSRTGQPPSAVRRRAG